MTKMEITVKYFLSICLLSLMTNSTLAGVMPEETNSPKIKQVPKQSNTLNYKVGNKNVPHKAAEIYKCLQAVRPAVSPAYTDVLENYEAFLKSNTK